MADLTKFVRNCLWANATWIEFIGARFMEDDYAVRRISHVLLGERAWFERYPRLSQDALGIGLSPSGAQVAWFKDPNGNVLSLTQVPT